MEHPTAFCTLALGAKYNFLALNLASDLARFAPSLPLIVLTDQPRSYDRHPNVVVVRHRQVSVFRCFHDKRFAFLEALSRAHSCIYLDADSRILAPVSSGPPGDAQGLLSGLGTENLVEKFRIETPDELRDGRLNTGERRLRLVTDACAKVGVDIERVTFVPECLIHVTRSGAERWLDAWSTLARFFELRGYSWGEGEAIGIAALVADWAAREWAEAGEWYFNDLHYSAEQRRATSPHANTIQRYLAERAMVDDAFPIDASRVRRVVRVAAEAQRYLGLLIGEKSHRARPSRPRPPQP
jgi:hypothetical protein